MTERFARACLFSEQDNYLVTIRVANGDYYELAAISKYHAEQKLHEFSSLNRLILTETAGFDHEIIQSAKSPSACPRRRRR
jgi:uncharacterized protein YqfB (UPF0267 family)